MLLNSFFIEKSVCLQKKYENRKGMASWCAWSKDARTAESREKWEHRARRKSVCL